MHDLISQLRRAGESDFRAPWPVANDDKDYHFNGNFYREWTISVFGAALALYPSIIKKWIDPIRQSLPMFSLFPAKLHLGGITSFQSWVSHYLEPLPLDEMSEVGIEPDLNRENLKNRASKVYEQLHTLRPERAPWVSYSYGSGILPVQPFNRYPIRELIYRWLAEDLGSVLGIHLFI